MGNANCGPGPEFTKDELFALRDWSSGIAFGVYAKTLNLEFDWDQLKDDSPNFAAFGFGRTAGPQCTMSVDVTAGYMGTLYALDNAYGKHLRGETSLADFTEYYFAQAKKYGFEQYILGEKLTSN